MLDTPIRRSNRAIGTGLQKFSRSQFEMIKAVIANHIITKPSGFKGYPSGVTDQTVSDKLMPLIPHIDKDDIRYWRQQLHGPSRRGHPKPDVKPVEPVKTYVYALSKPTSSSLFEQFTGETPSPTVMERIKEAEAVAQRLTVRVNTLEKRADAESAVRLNMIDAVELLLSALKGD